MSKISIKIKRKIRKDANNRCGYCQLPQFIIPNMLEIEHLLPLAEGGLDEEENLWLACRQCNLYKSAKIFGVDTLTFQEVKLFNPRQQIWSNHFIWSENKTEVIGVTPCGRATVLVLKLNDEYQVNARKLWNLTGIFPPKN